MYEKELALLRRVIPSIYESSKQRVKEIHFKGPDDMVTSSDLYIETKLIEAIKEVFVTDTFLTEEFHSKATLGKRTWIIDPIDGTSNFGVGLNLFVIQLALFEDNEIKLSVIYYPQEEKFYESVLGEGAKLNGVSYQVLDLNTPQNPMVSMVGYTLKSTEKKYYQKLLDYSVSKGVKLRMLGSIGLELSVASKGIFTVFYTNVKNLWDLAPGVLLAKEAKACLFNEKGEDYKLGDKHLFITKTETLKEEILKVINA
ncbi:MAG: inositol monophosphatase [Acholeplasma sp.]|nr:inositol monophosphatase [Acholeplasma sp.]